MQPAGSGASASPAPFQLFDLGFLEFDVLARDRIVLLEDELLGRIARVLLRDVEEAGVGGGDQPDLDGCGLRNGDAFLSTGVQNGSSGATAPPGKVAACGGESPESQGRESAGG